MTEEHGHEVDEPKEERDACANCILEAAVRKFSNFEKMAIDWYYSNVSQFTLDCGLVAELFRNLELKGIDKELFLRAMAMIHMTEKRIHAEREKKEMERKRNG